MKSLSAAALLLLLGGCSSVYDLAGGTDNGPQVFGGVRTWPEAVNDTFGIPNEYASLEKYRFIYMLCLVDALLSYAADVALLPVTLTFEIFRN
jgi:hypothetical protein